MPNPYPSEFRRKVLDLLAAEGSVSSIAADLGVSGQTIYNWRRQELIDTGQTPGVSTTEQAEPGRLAGGSPSWRPNWRSLAERTSC